MTIATTPLPLRLACLARPSRARALGRVGASVLLAMLTAACEQGADSEDESATAPSSLSSTAAPGERYAAPVPGSGNDDGTPTAPPCARPTAEWSLDVLLLDGLDGEQKADVPLREAIAFVTANSRVRINYGVTVSNQTHGYTPYGCNTNRTCVVVTRNDIDASVLRPAQSYLLLWALDGREPLQAGSTIGPSYGIPNGGVLRPYASVPADAWWYVNTPANGFQSWAAQILAHELINVLNTMLESPTQQVLTTTWTGANAAVDEAERLSKLEDAHLRVLDSCYTPPPSFSEQWGTVGDKPVPGDYMVAGRADLAVYRPSNGNWYIKRAGNSTVRFANFGLPDDVPVGGDFLGLGRSQIAQFRPSNGTWYIHDVTSGTGQVRQTQFGTAGDQPVPGNYVGGGATDVAVYRPSTGQFWVQDLKSGAVESVTFGSEPGGTAIGGRFLGGAHDQIAVWRAKDGIWTIRDLETGATRSIQWGAEGDVPFAIRYFDSSRTDLAVFRPSTGIVYIRAVDGERTAGLQWGTTGDRPLAGDFMGTGKQEIAQWRESTGVWWIKW